jgi:hypothetical protein
MLLQKSECDYSIEIMVCFIFFIVCISDIVITGHQCSKLEKNFNCSVYNY